MGIDGHLDDIQADPVRRQARVIARLRQPPAAWLADCFREADDVQALVMVTERSPSRMIEVLAIYEGYRPRRSRLIHC